MDDETDVFFKNKHSWNKEANMVYLESPAGVGFSICGDPKECVYDDYTSSDDNIIALRNFFLKFPEFAKHELYLTGESYAGIYVPYLAW
jgi:carboxypeptidase C (cathepsin A)